MPAAVTAGTRASYDGPWLAFLVFAVANRRERDVMPASADLVRAFMAFLVAADLAASSIARYMQALKDHHRRHRKPFPVAAVELKRWIRAVTRISTRTPPQLAPVSAEQLRRLLLLPM
eukprot:2385591-Rhodomonas_salina.1